MKDKKAAKLIIKRAKEHPDWYSEMDIKYAKMVKRRIKREKQLRDAELNDVETRDSLSYLSTPFRVL